MTRFSFQPSALVLLLFAGLANTCVHAPPASRSPHTTEQKAVIDPTMEPLQEPLPPAVHSLLRQSQGALDRQQFQEAEAHVERAYRMNGRDFRVLFMRARISLASGDAADAEQWAQRALDALPPRYKAQRTLTLDFIARARAALQSQNQASSPDASSPTSDRP